MDTQSLETYYALLRVRPLRSEAQGILHRVVVSLGMWTERMVDTVAALVRTRHNYRQRDIAADS